MLTIYIRGLENGTHPVNLSTPVDKIPYMFPEFDGNVVFNGEIVKSANKYFIKGVAECSARLVCDRSGEDYSETISAPISLSYIANTDMYLLRRDESDPEQPYYIHEDDKEIDITDEVRQELAINLPMKRIAPAHRDKDLDDLFPSTVTNADSGDDEPKEDERWAQLKKIRFPNSDN